MTPAEFQVVEVGPDMVYIVDTSDGRPVTSVTNDAEGVCRRVNLEHPGKRIIYCDTDGNWDELRHDNGRFIGFAPARRLAPGFRA